MKLPEIVGVAGTNGSGKDTLGELLVERKNYKFVSVSDILRVELSRQEVPHTREAMRALSSMWARERGLGYLCQRTIELYRNEDGYDGLAIGSVRRPAEAQAIKDEQGSVAWIDAERRLRYERIVAAERGRHEDTVSFEDWVTDEDKEMSPPPDDDGSAINMLGVRAIADIRINNNFVSKEAYRNHLIDFFEL